MAAAEVKDLKNGTYSATFQLSTAGILTIRQF